LVSVARSKTLPSRTSARSRESDRLVVFRAVEKRVAQGGRHDGSEELMAFREKVLAAYPQLATD
jgi:hypothetical protein